MRAVVLLAVVAAARAQDSTEPLTIGPGITPPKLPHKIEPQYTREAREAVVQGTALLEIVIETDGKANDIRILSPIGFGLDEKAIEAIRQWRFKPAGKDGKPVRVRANVEVNFRFMDTWFDRRAERQRTLFNTALRRLREPESVGEGEATMLELAKEKFPPAAYVVSTWMREG